MNQFDSLSLKELTKFLKNNRPNHSQMLTALGEHPWDREKILDFSHRNKWELLKILKETPGAKYFMHVQSIKVGCELSRLSLAECLEPVEKLKELCPYSSETNDALLKPLEIAFTKGMYSFLLIAVSTLQYAKKFVGINSVPVAEEIFDRHRSLLTTTTKLRNSVAHHGLTPARWFFTKNFETGVSDAGFSIMSGDMSYADFKESTFKEISNFGSLLKFIENSQKNLELFCGEYTTAVLDELAEQIQLTDKYCFWNTWRERGTDEIYEDKSGTN